MALRLPEQIRNRIERFFDASTVSYVSGVLTIVVAIGTATSTWIANSSSASSSAPLIATSTSSAGLLVAVGFLAMAHAQKIRKIRRLLLTVSQQGAGYANLVQAYTSNIWNVNAIFGEFVKGLSGADPRGAHLGFFVNRVKSIFDCLSSSGQSAVCIKLLKHDHGLDDFVGPFLWTAKRDDISSLQREKTDHLPRLRRYAPDENKAFSDIMSRHVSRDYFFCGDLQAMGSDYFNSNPHWRDLYNAAVVVPIKPCRRDVLESTIGFLCVDSLHGKMNEDISVSTLVLIAEILYLHISVHPHVLLESGSIFD